MSSSIRQPWEGIVFRLYPDQQAAQQDANLLNKTPGSNFVPQMHASENGYIVKDETSGKVYDVAGLVR